MTNSFLIGKTIFGIITESEVNATLNKRVFPIAAENGTNYPFVVYKRQNVSDGDRTKDGVINDVVSFEIVVVDNEYNRCAMLANDIRNLFGKNRIANDLMTLNYTQLVSASEDFSSDAYVQKLVFTTRVE